MMPKYYRLNLSNLEGVIPRYIDLLKILYLYIYRGINFKILNELNIPENL